MKTLLILPLLFLACALHAQTKPETKPILTLSQPEVISMLSKLDSLAVVAIRSDMLKSDRNYTTDKLQELKMYLINKFNEQNPPKKEEVKTEGKKP